MASSVERRASTSEEGALRALEDIEGDVRARLTFGGGIDHVPVMVFSIFRMNMLFAAYGRWKRCGLRVLCVHREV